MKQKLSPAQEDINNRIDILRMEKEELKNNFNLQLHDIDSEILELRQSLFVNPPIEEKPKRKTQEQKLEERLAELTKELDELKTKLGVNQ